jgi:hypothetical protein
MTSKQLHAVVASLNSAIRAAYVAADSDFSHSLALTVSEKLKDLRVQTGYDITTSRMTRDGLVTTTRPEVVPITPDLIFTVSASAVLPDHESTHNLCCAMYEMQQWQGWAKARIASVKADTTANEKANILRGILE